ncbi:MAG TPA: hypothetical protein ENH88_07420 [Pseudoalteromonas prydzensis]|uniref:Uncharacterized protein n=2 Tax=Pseudoalteromonas prydzensis TaxID=182141 RepID=A0A7V1CY06_9GAMM|nr:hypothetical protein [Pseudoalteromonas prydzensis]
MTINFNIHQAVSLTTTNQPKAPIAPQQQVIDAKKEVEAEPEAIAAFTGEAQKSSPYSALLNPEGFDFSNMSINEFKGIVDAVRKLESDTQRASGNTESLRGTFWDDVMGVKGPLDNIDFAEKTFSADDKININAYFESRVDEAQQMRKEHPRSFSKVVGYAQSALSTVEKLTSESFIKEYQAKAVEFLKSQDTPLIKTQA